MPVKIIHFHNGSGGGVFSVIKNLLQFSQHNEIENHVIYIINKEQTPLFVKPLLEGAASQQVFYYSPKWNFYYTCKRLAALLADEKAVIVAHDWLELGMVSNLGLENPVVQVVHGDYDYYYELVQKHEHAVDAVICISKSIYRKVKTIYAGTVLFQYVPVPPIKFKSRLYKDPVTLVFAGRCEKSKGYELLPQIEQNLRIHNIRGKWIIAGSGSLEKGNQMIWPSGTQITFAGELPQAELYKLLQAADFFILPSLAEGVPISIVEAMKAGAVPLVNKGAGSSDEIISHAETGFLVENNEPSKYADFIYSVIKDKDAMALISRNAAEYSNYLFDPYKNTSVYEQYFMNAAAVKRKKRKVKVYGSRLDQSYLPNWFVSRIREYLK